MSGSSNRIGGEVFDSRDVIERLAELRAERDALTQAVEDADGSVEDGSLEAADAHKVWKAAQLALEEWENGDAAEELTKLEALEDSCGSGEWDSGMTFIRESYFEEYCEEMVEDIGDLPNDIPRYLVIDWSATADNLKADYRSVDFDGDTYWYR